MPLRTARFQGDEFSPATASDETAATRAATPAPPSQTQLAVGDVVEGAQAWRLWGVLGWHDIRQRYRRSKIGPFWLTISMAAMVGGIGFLFGGLFNIELADYLPFLALGIIIWGLIAALINENCNVFIEAEPIIKQVRLPLSVHVYRVVWRNLIIFGHNSLVFIVVAAIFAVWPGWTGLLALPGFVLLCLNGVWVGLLLGLIAARFRDVPQIVASIVQVTFFMTPVIWKPDRLPERAWILHLNPFHHFLELVRTPLLGGVPGLASWLTVLAVTLVGWTVALLMYRRYRRRIAYWL